MANIKVVCLVLFDKRNRILLQLRSDYKPRYANYWGLFGGHSKHSSEKIQETLRRELKEELGYQVKNPIFLFSQELPKKSKEIFVEPFDTTQTLTPDGAETKQLGWFTVAEAIKLKIIPHDLEVLKRVEEYLKKIA